MQLGLVGLGKMGANMARRLAKDGHQVLVYNRTASVAQELATEVPVTPVLSLEALVGALKAPRIVWTMVPAGQPTEDMIVRLVELLSPGDIVVDGGNSNFNDSIRRAAFLEAHQIHFLDVGVSGGIWGLTEGYALMIGGEEEIARQLAPVFQTLAPGAEKGWGWMGPHGAGHFVKMVHNGIEYGMMEAYAEGFELLQARKDFNLDLHKVSQVWQYGSVVRSWLLDLTERALAEDPGLESLHGWVADSGEGRWTVFEAINNDVPAPVIAASLFRRFDSRQDESYAAKLLAAMRNQFGGHAVHKVE